MHIKLFILNPTDNIPNINLQAKRKGFWTLFVEFPGNRYSKSPGKIISRDSHKHWVCPFHFQRVFLLAFKFLLYTLSLLIF